ncbi:MAG: co-chaperone DjlA, partial [Pseudomonadota bacterium]
VAVEGSDPAAMDAFFAGIDGRIDVAIYNPSARSGGPVAELDPEEVRRAIARKHIAGKTVGGLLGLAVKGPVGALVGLVLGHQFDRGIAKFAGADTDPEVNIQELFFAATFAVLGHVAKSDGRVSENEIAYARAIMQRFDLNEQRRKDAIAQFTRGKAPDFPLDAVLNQLMRGLKGRDRLVHQFMQIQVDAMLADRQAHPRTRELLWRICQRIGVSRVDLAHMEANAHARLRGADNQGSIEDAYKVLGVDKTVDNKGLKTAYRRLMNKHHPDKLIARGLPQEMMNEARQQTQAIQAAYETIKQARGLR